MASLTEGDSKTCPSCAEVVRAGATRCRFCGHLFTSPVVELELVLPPSAPERVNAAAPIEALDIADLLESLVERSLLVFDEAIGRFRLLDTVRDYASHKLSADARRSEIHSRHLEFYTELAEASKPQLQGADVVQVLSGLTREEANFRSALDWAAQTDRDLVPALRACTGLALYWHIRGQFTEGRKRCAVVLDHAAASDAPADPSVVAGTLSAAGNLAFAQGDFERAAAAHREALLMRDGSSDRDGLAMSLHNLAIAEAALGHLECSLDFEERALALNRMLGNRLREASNLNSLAMMAAQQGEHDKAASLYEETHRIAREAGDRWTECHALFNLGELRLRQKEFRVSRERLVDCLRVCRELDFWPMAAVTCETLARLEAEEGQLAGCALAMGVATSIRGSIDLLRNPEEEEDARKILGRIKTEGASAQAALLQGSSAKPTDGIELVIRAVQAVRQLEQQECDHPSPK